MTDPGGYPENYADNALWERDLADGQGRLRGWLAPGDPGNTQGTPVTFDPHAVFNEEFDKAIQADVEESGFPVEEWFRNGNALPATAVDSWRIKGGILVERFTEWFDKHCAEDGWEVWVTPDGRPAIELELNPKFGDIEVRMFIDLIVKTPQGLIIWDFKSGARKPDNYQQLAIYAGGVELAYGVRPLYGGYYFPQGYGPRGCPPENLKFEVGPIPLISYEFSVPYFAEQFAQMEAAVQAGSFLANVSKDTCDRCGVAWACLARGGWAADQYDPSHPNWRGPLAARPD